MNYYKTPFHIVRLIRRHVPKKAEKVLEPAVGEGALLEALYKEQINKFLTVVDIDNSRLSALRACYKNVSFVNDNFIDWSINAEGDEFDLIVTNPPFSGKSKEWIVIGGKRMPIELAFICLSRKMLKAGGTLLAIVPDTVINSLRFVDERREIILSGSVEYVYQLPKKTFSGIEGTFYLMVFKGGKKTRKVKLRKYEYSVKEELVVDINELSSQSYRLDYSYYSEFKEYNKHYMASKKESGALIGDFCNVKRGAIREGYKREGLVHTNSFERGYWKGFEPSSDGKKDLCILAKRVSRDAHLSFGFFDKEKRVSLTDCVISIESDKVCVKRLLFFLRVMFSNKHGEGLIMKGAGAKFISIEAIKNVMYFDISSLFPREFLLYFEAYFSNEFVLCREIESAVFSKFRESGKVSSLEFEALRKEVLRPKEIRECVAGA